MIQIMMEEFLTLLIFLLCVDAMPASIVTMVALQYISGFLQLQIKCLMRKASLKEDLNHP